MSIDTLSWHAAKAAAVSAALLCTATMQSHAAPRISVPAAATAAAFRALYPVAPIVEPSSFTERFAGTHLGAVGNILASPGFHAGFAPAPMRYEPAAAAIVGAASTYDPTDAGDRDAGSIQTSSGEAYDPESWTAAIQIDLRWQFGGVRYGRNYVPAYALVECNGMRAIVKINDVGPLRPGRIIDLNTRAMRFFDPTMKIGVLNDVKVTLLAGTKVAVGPVDGWTVMAGDYKPVWE